MSMPSLPKEKPLTPTQIRVLRNVRDGYEYDRHAEGMSGYAGAQTTMHSLVRRGLLHWRADRYLVITALGRATLREIDKER